MSSVPAGALCFSVRPSFARCDVRDALLHLVMTGCIRPPARYPASPFRVGYLWQSRTRGILYRKRKGVASTRCGYHCVHPGIQFVHAAAADVNSTRRRCAVVVCRNGGFLELKAFRSPAAQSVLCLISSFSRCYRWEVVFRACVR